MISEASPSSRESWAWAELADTYACGMKNTRNATSRMA